jgi:hypothetical protein
MKIDQKITFSKGLKSCLTGRSPGEAPQMPSGTRGLTPIVVDKGDRGKLGRIGPYWKRVSHRLIRNQTDPIRMHND